jgi:hypothetical protein
MSVGVIPSNALLDKENILFWASYHVVRFDGLDNSVLEAFIIPPALFNTFGAG